MLVQPFHTMAQHNIQTLDQALTRFVSEVEICLSLSLELSLRYRYANFFLRASAITAAGSVGSAVFLIVLSSGLQKNKVRLYDPLTSNDANTCTIFTNDFPIFFFLLSHFNVFLNNSSDLINPRKTPQNFNLKRSTVDVTPFPRGL